MQTGYYRVALPIPRSSPLTYHSSDDIQVGSRVLVPLGRRIITGAVVGANAEVYKGAKEIQEVLDDVPAFTETILELTRRIGEYYLCSWGEVIDAALPTGLAPSSVVRITLVKPVDQTELNEMTKKAPKRAQLLRLLDSHPEDVTIDYLQKQLRSTTISYQIDALLRLGFITVQTEIERLRTVRLVRAVRIADALTANDDLIKQTLDALDVSAPKQSIVLGQLYLAYHRNEGPVPVQHLRKVLGLGVAAIDALVGKGLAVECTAGPLLPTQEVEPTLMTVDERHVKLTDEQRKAVASVSEGLGAFSQYLLEGVTGSGKTVVYQRIMDAALRKNKTCLMLVPEISLTPQLQDRFRAVFGDKVAVLHSGMAVGERVGVWRRIRQGELTIVIGARSAVFAPLANVGVIIVDEEHEPSYKQNDPSPRYHGRDAAILRAQLERCPVILGSATPSLESIHNMKINKFRYITLSQRIDGATLPKIEIVDMRTEHRTGNALGTISKRLLDAIIDRVTKKEGTILFLNRRGYAVQMQCEDCGAVPQCPNCDVSLTWHKATATLKCHYCGHTEPARTACATCGGIDLTESGIGTQRVEEDVTNALASMLPEVNAVVERMDTDTTRRRGSHRKILTRFIEGKADVLIGTQMVSKGLDIPRVTLVGVVNADQSLYQSDFRSQERTAQLLIQVSGRAGRTASHPGLVVIQTSSEEHPVIQAVLNNSQKEWCERELELRRELLYPPFSRFIVIQFSSSNQERVEHAATVVSKLLPTNNPALLWYPPQLPPIPRMRNRYRRVIVIKNPKAEDPSGSACRAVLNAVIAAYFDSYASAAVRVSIDVDASGTL